MKCKIIVLAQNARQAKLWATKNEVPSNAYIYASGRHSIEGYQNMPVIRLWGHRNHKEYAEIAESLAIIEACSQS